MADGRGIVRRQLQVLLDKFGEGQPAVRFRYVCLPNVRHRQFVGAVRYGELRLRSVRIGDRIYVLRTVGTRLYKGNDIGLFFRLRTAAACRNKKRNRKAKRRREKKT